jgi:hypothetical protein
MGRILCVFAAGLAFLWLSMCGGIAVIDGPTGDGGQGGNGATSTRASTTAPGPGQGPITTVTSGTGTTSGGFSDCDAACSALYDCGLQGGSDGMKLCPGFSGNAMEKAQFVDGCVTACQDMPALLILIDPSDCAGTITVLKGASPDFADLCANGF